MVGIQLFQQCGDFELVADVERGSRLVEQQDVGRLRKGGRDDHALLLAAAQRGE